MTKVTQVIFDVDGLILDTESIYTEFTSNFLSGYNIQFDYNIRKLMTGRKPHEVGNSLVTPRSSAAAPQSYRCYLSPDFRTRPELLFVSPTVASPLQAH
ncbi:hypothetical protein Smp_178890 [Schistosoma mansoni]|uniref:hypothetical protein n=1 Tax=Schistosoma mansoni TaxID=6183 RepID=UPI00022C82D9|nr:hypothetical protein Smp_178890 [Schistosoma mansoni]|eukprot:XP_018646406.1 hypothetical protein Smp_178890 [Schistosoma mansoni]